MRGPTDLVMVFYVDEATSLSDLSDSWKGRKLPGKKKRDRQRGKKGIEMICDSRPSLPRFPSFNFLCEKKRERETEGKNAMFPDSSRPAGEIFPRRRFF